jgi:hypothetical protein
MDSRTTSPSHSSLVNRYKSGLPTPIKNGREDAAAADDDAAAADAADAADDDRPKHDRAAKRFTSSIKETTTHKHIARGLSPHPKEVEHTVHTEHLSLGRGGKRLLVSN